MKHFTPILFTLVLLIQIGLKLGIGVWFLANQEEIIDKYCVNKDNEALQCNGKCHLNKQITLIDQHDTGNEKSTDEKQQNKLPVIQEFIPMSSYSFSPQANLTAQEIKFNYRTRFYFSPFYSTDLPPPKNNA